MTTLLSILVLLSSLTLIVTVLVSEPVENNMGVITGGNSESFWGGNKGNSKPAMLNKVTIAAAVVLLLSLILLLKM